MRLIFLIMQNQNKYYILTDFGWDDFGWMLGSETTTKLVWVVVGLALLATAASCHQKGHGR